MPARPVAVRAPPAAAAAAAAAASSPARFRALARNVRASARTSRATVPPRRRLRGVSGQLSGGSAPLPGSPGQLRGKSAQLPAMSAHCAGIPRNCPEGPHNCPGSPRNCAEGPRRCLKVLEGCGNIICDYFSPEKEAQFGGFCPAGARGGGPAFTVKVATTFSTAPSPGMAKTKPPAVLTRQHGRLRRRVLRASAPGVGPGGGTPPEPAGEDAHATRSQPVSPGFCAP